MYHSVALEQGELAIVASEMIEAVLIHPERTFPEADDILAECAKRVHQEEKLPESMKKTKLRWNGISTVSVFPFGSHLICQSVILIQQVPT